MRADVFRAAMISEGTGLFFSEHGSRVYAAWRAFEEVIAHKGEHEGESSGHGSDDAKGHGAERSGQTRQRRRDGAEDEDGHAEDAGCRARAH